MGYRNIDKDDPRYDPSSMVIKVDDEEIEWMAFSYGDDTDIPLARAGGTPMVVGQGPGSYMPKGGSLRMHKNFARDYFRRLFQQAQALGANRVSAVPHIVTVAFAEWNMATTVDRIEALRFKGKDPGSAEGGGNSLSMVEVPVLFSRVKWDGDIQM
jgi:hypothetical protein